MYGGLGDDVHNMYRYMHVAFGVRKKVPCLFSHVVESVRTYPLTALSSQCVCPASCDSHHVLCDTDIMTT